MGGAEALGHERLDLLAHELVPVIPEQLLRLSVDEHDRSLVVHDHHRVRRRLHELAELLLGTPLVRHVLCGAEHPHGVAAVIRLDLAAAVNDAGGAVVPDDAMLEAEGRVLDERPAKRSVDRVAILRVNVAQEALVVGGEPSRPEPVEPVQLSGPGDLVRGNVPLPASDVSDALRFAEQLHQPLTSLPQDRDQNAGHGQRAGGHHPVEGRVRRVALGQERGAEAGDRDHERGDGAPEIEEEEGGQDGPEVVAGVGAGRIGAPRVDDHRDDDRPQPRKQVEGPDRDALEADQHHRRDRGRDDCRAHDPGNETIGVMWQEQGQHRKRRPHAEEVGERLGHDDGARDRQEAAHAPTEPSKRQGHQRALTAPGSLF